MMTQESLDPAPEFEGEHERAPLWRRSCSPSNSGGKKTSLCIKSDWQMFEAKEKTPFKQLCFVPLHA